VKTLPLDGLLVADFTRVLAGPLCTQLLADEGARVIKVEEPGRGDETRRWGPPWLGGASTYFLSVNRNKESLTLDLRAAADAGIARELLRRADVVIDNFLPAQRQALGLADVLALNPRAIHCSITGFEPDGPSAAVPGYDLLAQAGSGLMSITGATDGSPMKVGVAVTDVLTGHYAHGAILAALYARERSGRGARLEVSLFGAAAASLVNVAQAALATGREAKRHGNAHASIVPYQLFEGSDRAFAVGAGTDRHYRLLCEQVAMRPELVHDARFATNDARVQNREELGAIFNGIFATQPAQVWVERCRAAAVPVSLVSGVLESLRSDDARPLLASVKHPEAGSYETVAHPVRFDGERLPVRTAPPLLGEQDEALRRELAPSHTTDGTVPHSRGTRTPGGRS
jgi:crotonobetainyl-CoA:carnitine CoA-transferase CaiB-like acyl-CoA transferase